MRPSTLRQAESFTVALGVALHRFGVPIYRVDESMARVAQAFDLEANFLTSATSVQVAFGRQGEQHLYTAQLGPSEVNLEKLAHIDRVARDVCDKRMELRNGLKKLRAIVDGPAGHKPLWSVLAFGLIASAFAVMVGGSHYDALAAAPVGLLIGILAWICGRWTPLGQLFELAAACAASLGAHALAAHVQPVSVYVVTVAGLVVILPGLALTVSMMEIATFHLTAGTARSMGVLVSFLKLGFGVALGARCATIFGWAAGPSPDVVALPTWWLWPALLSAACAFTVLLEARWRDTPWIMAVGALAVWGTRWGTQVLGADMAPVLSAFLVTLASNVYGRVFNRLAMLILVPGLLLQVPGSLAYRSIAELYHREVLTGVETAFSVLAIAVAMVAGILLANSVVSPRRL